MENEQPKLLGYVIFMLFTSRHETMYLSLHNIQFGQNLRIVGFFHSRTSSINAFDQSFKESCTQNMLEKKHNLIITSKHGQSYVGVFR